MTYQVRKKVATFAATLIVLFMYIQYVMHYTDANGQFIRNLEFWSRSILLHIIIGIVLLIVGQIIAAVIGGVKYGVDIKKKGKNQAGDIDVLNVEDEMDQLIALKSTRMAYAIVGLGFVVGLITLAYGITAAIMLNIAFISFLMASVIESGVSIYYYLRGVQRG